MKNAINILKKSANAAANTLKATLVAAVTSSTAMAAGGGLTEASSAMTDIKVWAYSFLGICIFVYLIYLVVMALIDKMQWNEVAMGVGKVAACGGIILAGEWAWAIWGS